eukprot:7217558-Prymnesium_polylepis.1
MPKAAKVTHPPRRPLNCESDPPLKALLPPPVTDTRQPGDNSCDRIYVLRETYGTWDNGREEHAWTHTQVHAALRPRGRVHRKAPRI